MRCNPVWTIPRLSQPSSSTRLNSFLCICGLLGSDQNNPDENDNSASNQLPCHWLAKQEVCKCDGENRDGAEQNREQANLNQLLSASIDPVHNSRSENGQHNEHYNRPHCELYSPRAVPQHRWSRDECGNRKYGR